MTVGVKLKIKLKPLAPVVAPVEVAAVEECPDECGDYAHPCVMVFTEWVWSPDYPASGSPGVPGIVPDVAFSATITPGGSTNVCPGSPLNPGLSWNILAYHPTEGDISSHFTVTDDDGVYTLVYDGAFAPATSTYIQLQAYAAQGPCEFLDGDTTTFPFGPMYEFYLGAAP